MKRALLVATVFLVVFTAACGGGGGGAPDQVAKQWFQALAKGDQDTLKSLTCAASQSDMTDAFGSLAEMAGTVTIDVSGLSFKTTEESGDNATVQVSGNIKVELLGQSAEEPMNEDMPMVKEGGKWKVCGY